MKKTNEAQNMPDLKKTTDDLNKLIKEKKDVTDFLKENSNEFMFSNVQELLEFHIKTKGLKKSEVLERANIAKSYGYEILNGGKSPSRDKYIAICFGMKLNLNETNRVLKQAGLSELYVRKPRDAIIISAIYQGKSLIETNEKLDELGEDPIM